MKIILQKSFVREFPLVLVQMWGKRYSSEFLGVKFAERPIYVFKIDDGLVTAYRNVLGQEKLINSIIKNKVGHNPNFITDLVRSNGKEFEQLNILQNKKVLSKGEFITFTNKLYECWPIHYIAQFVPLDKTRFELKDRQLAFNLRKTVDKSIMSYWNSVAPLLKKIYPELNELVNSITWDEALSLKIPSQKNLTLRKSKGVTLFNGKLINETQLVKLEHKYNFKIESQSIKNVQQVIKGQVAYKGNVTGKVRKVLKEADIKYFKKGEVLVSYMTMPHFMPALKKAIAFVTDEGGLTCHAAIIARELKKPTVIGTMHATKIFKDGDMVEVDANKGIVRKI